MAWVKKLQSHLDFEGWESPQFKTQHGLGRVGLAGFGLGLVCGFHLSLLCVATVVTLPYHGVVVQWSLYAMALSGFHFSEFIVTALYKPASVSYNSYVINHSLAYTAAAIASWVEFWLETLLMPRSAKFRPALFAAGLVLVVVGQGCRAAAMWTCKTNFNHIIMETKEPGHELVTHGVYSLLRHPSYFGWFWWCVGTQMVLCNPLCVAAYAYAAWDFFRHRVPYEEATLVRFYPETYPAYMQRTHIGIPFVKGIDTSNLPPAPRREKDPSAAKEN